MEDATSLLQAVQVLDTIIRWVSSIVGIVIAVIMFFVVRHDARLKALEEKHSLFSVDLPTNYLSKAEHRRAMDIINENQAVAYNRLEKGQSEIKKELKEDMAKTDMKLDKIFDIIHGKS